MVAVPPNQAPPAEVPEASVSPVVELAAAPTKTGANQSTAPISAAPTTDLFQERASVSTVLLGSAPEPASEGPSDRNAQRAHREPRRGQLALLPRTGEVGLAIWCAKPVTNVSKRRKAGTPKPEIVCWKREREWILAVELPDELSENQGLTMVQGDRQLEEDAEKRGCWPLAQLRGDVVVMGADVDRSR